MRVGGIAEHLPGYVVWFLFFAVLRFLHFILRSKCSEFRLQTPQKFYAGHAKRA